MRRKVFPEVFRYFVLLLLIVCILKTNSLAEIKIVGYYPTWLKSTLPAEKIAFDNITHINHSFVYPDSDGTILYESDFLYPRLIEQTHHAGAKVLLAIGGWGQSNGFGPMAADSAARENFINNVIAFCNDYNYDGIDLDWEFPENDTDKINLNLLVKDLREQFNKENPHLFLTMAISANPWVGQWIDYQTLMRYVDWFGCMTYDVHGSWSENAGHNSPLYAPPDDFSGSVHTGIQYLHVERKIPENQLLLGIPFFGKLFNAKDLYVKKSGEVINLNYPEIIAKIGSDWIYKWDEISMVPYLMNSDQSKIITFDDTVSVRIKCEYALQNNLAGVMIWALGQDVTDFNQPLLATIGNTIFYYSDVKTTTPAKSAKSFKLFNSYPNPFNSSAMISYYVPYRDKIILEIYDILGKKISVLVNEIKTTGIYVARFDSGNISSGIYIYRLRTSKSIIARKMLILK